jgi:hypothetical protein
MRSQRDPLKVRFDATNDPTADPLMATLTITPKEGPVLELVTTDGHSSGRWRAGVCTASGDQIGIIEILL